MANQPDDYKPTEVDINRVGVETTGKPDTTGR